jgi:hypothetical protein
MARFWYVPYVEYAVMLDMLVVVVVGSGHSLREAWDSQLPVVMVVFILFPQSSVVFVVYTSSSKMS